MQAHMLIHTQESATRYSHPILFGLLLLFALIEGCDTAYLTGSFNGCVYPASLIGPH